MGIFGNAFGWPHLVIIVLVVLVLFGASKLPIFAKGLGQSIKIFRKEMTDVQEDIREDRDKRSSARLDKDTVTVPDTTSQTRSASEAHSQTRSASEDR